MQKHTIGIIGNGVLGSAISHGFQLQCNVRIYDRDPLKATHTLEETCDADFVFLCLPSPMTIKEGGPTDLTIINNVCQKISSLGLLKPIYILKSTVPIGTTENMRNKYGLRIVHSPEFLTARNADIDFITTTRTILGGDSTLTQQVAPLFENRFPGHSIIYMESNESEAAKYILNAFFMVKVLFFNEMKLGLEKQYNLDWETVLKGVLTDGRIGISHYQVPGHDGKVGCGGFCFSKDICSIIDQISSKGFDPIMLKACWEQNKRLRPEMDWADSPSGVTQN